VDPRYRTVFHVDELGPIYACCGHLESWTHPFYNCRDYFLKLLLLYQGGAGVGEFTKDSPDYWHLQGIVPKPALF
jgi:hypothetical protein